MNLTEALNVALPRMQDERRVLPNFPRPHPKLISRQHVEGGESIVVAHVPGTAELFRFLPDQWALLQLFDGRRSYAEVSEEFRRRTGIEISEPDLRKFAQMLQDNGFWYETAHDTYLSYAEAESARTRSRKSRFGDLARVDLWAWDPDTFLTRLHNHASFLYSGWFTALTIGFFGFMFYVFVDRWGEISHDTLLYYDFTRKNAGDLLEFWLLFMVLCFLHESAHGLTCKHYGAGVHRMGFQLLYLEPTFFVEVTEGWVYANRQQRMAIILAGVWVELICCAVATFVFWGTAPGTGPHEMAYKVMLITGAAVVVIEMMPFIKLDGYYLFCELVGTADLKERSTDFSLAWIKRKIFRMQAEAEYVSHKRAWLYAAYAITSGAYSYLLLLAIALFAYHVLRNYIPEWAFVPALFLVFLMFRSRLHKVAAFIKLVWLEKAEIIRAWLRSTRMITVGVFMAAILFVPFLHRVVEGRSYLEPVRRAVVRAEVPGEILQVSVEEGQEVRPGMSIASLRNLTLESTSGEALADLSVAGANATQAQLQYGLFAAAEQERQGSAERSRSLGEESGHLRLFSPISGVVVTPRVRDLVGSYARAGTAIVEIADLSQMRVRIYIPEYSLQWVRLDSPVLVKLDGRFGAIEARLASLAPASTDPEPGLIEIPDYEGIRSPHYYLATVVIPNEDRALKEGMAATAKIYSDRHSVAALAWRALREFLARKIW
jgi:putative peptide zinc metalloprotease protein